MRVVSTIEGVRSELAPHADSEIGLVPTMGALHAGHVSLLDRARRECDRVVMSLFVNPTQFSDSDDLERYPRDQGQDEERAAASGVDLIFSPDVETLYPPGFQTWVDVEEVSQGLEGSARPGHFRAVATVCLKLFNIVRPTRAYFGQKDAQQAAVVTRMASDLDLDLSIEVVPTVRDADGLALSSRNALLSPEQRATAVALPRALETGRTAAQANESPVAAARAVLEHTPGIEIDYVEQADLDGRSLLLAAITVGATRLIDNVELPTPARKESA